MAGDDEKHDAPLRLCPVVHVTDITPCPTEELDPLIDWISSEDCTFLEVAKVFPRGTVLPSGRLDLCKQSVGAQGVARLLDAIGGESPIKHILFGTDGLGDEGAKSVALHIEEYDALETVYLGCNAIRQPGLSALCEAVSTSRETRALWLKRNPVRPEGAKWIAAMLRRNEGIRTLDLTNTELTDEGVITVCQAAAGHPTLEHLNLGGNGVTELAAPILSTLVADSPNLQSLALGVNHLGDEGARVIAGGLAKSRLLRLDLSSNGVGPDGFRVLLESVSRMTTFQHLSFGVLPSSYRLHSPPNHIGDEGAGVLASYLANDGSMLSVYIDSNGLSTPGAKKIEAALDTNFHLSCIRFGKGIGRKTKRRINMLLARNAALHPPPGVERHVELIRSVYRTAPNS